ncbi:MAG: methyltransferase, partial [Proteobacteria bacterium]|nr:methyltransferase [Pseudomonadota bacterium]
AGAVEVALPAGAFVQPTGWGEAAIGARLDAILPAAGAVADLFAGCGLLGFALGPQRRVEAFESVAAMVSAARQAAMAAQRKTFRATQRDLERSPLDAAELARFDAVVLDPPRAGARAQAEALAASAVPTIAYVSCHPGSFARDARTLADGGYELVSLAPLDQFLWSHHLELVGHFARR